MKEFIQLKLRVLAKIILAKYKPKIIGITGSVGKTGAKDAVYTVLTSRFNVRRNIKNYNNEIGVPLTIIGAPSPGKSLVGWVLVFVRAVKLILIKDKNYPEILVLEMAVDKPGDMKYLNSIAECKIGIVTKIGSSHIEFFGTIDNIQREKSLLIKNLPNSGWAILNSDDELVLRMKGETGAKVLTYGFGPESDLRARKMIFGLKKKGASDNSPGVSFEISRRDSLVPVHIPNVIGEPSVYAALAAAAVGTIYGINLADISKSLRKFRYPKGRMNIIEGIKDTLIIDDTYNSSPQSSVLALETVKKIPVPKGSKKFAVLGDMLELGGHSEEGHREVGLRIPESNIDKLITIGEMSRDIGRGAHAAGMRNGDIFHFASAKKAKKFVQERIKKGDLILVKGSQGVRMEKIVKEIMSEPLRAKELLVRQDEQWATR